jgi:hypothetical protein
MDTGIVDVAAYSREAMRLDIHELMNPNLQKPLDEESCLSESPAAPFQSILVSP